MALYSSDYESKFHVEVVHARGVYFPDDGIQ